MPYASSVNGSDVNDGLTLGTAKRTIAGFGTLQNNTAYYLISDGSIFNETVSVPNGTTGIVFDKYGDGPMPIITGDGITGNDTTFALRGALGKIRNIYVKPTSHATLRNTIKLATTSDQCVVEYCVADGVFGFSGSQCIVVQSNTIGTVQYCEVPVGRDGIQVDRVAAYQRAIIQHNKVHNVSQDAIRSINGDFNGGVLLLGNEIYDYGDDGIDMFNGSGIVALLNHIYLPAITAAGSGVGIKAGGTTSVKNYIWSNYIHDLLYGSVRSGIRSNGATGPEYVGNLIVNALWGLDLSGGNTTAARVLLNTAVKCTRGFNSAGNNVGILQDNILDGSESDLKLNTGDNFTGGGNVLKNQASITGGTYSGTDLLATDPLFINYQGGNFALRSDSPARGFGKNLDFLYDFYRKEANFPHDSGAINYMDSTVSLDTDRLIDTRRRVV